MRTYIRNKINLLEDDYDTIIIPYVEDKVLNIDFPKEFVEILKVMIENKNIDKISCIINKKIVNIILFNFTPYKEATVREFFLAWSKILKNCKEQKSKKIYILLENLPIIFERKDYLKKIFQLPYLVNYNFDYYKTVTKSFSFEEINYYIVERDIEEILKEAKLCAKNIIAARDLVNYPSKIMSVDRFVDYSKELALKLEVEIKIYEEKEIEKLGMNAFLAVAQGDKNHARLVVMKYKGNLKEDEFISIVGKGIIFDSGGYCLKEKMDNMHGDMGGAAAALQAFSMAVLQKLPINILLVIPLCKNMMSEEAFLPGDIIKSMNGKTIEILNTDAEGRLLLVDAITYALREEKISKIIDIATLTGAATKALGIKTAAVVSNNNNLYNFLELASQKTGEKIWRLNADTELLEVLKSDVADIKSSNPGNSYGGGAIVAALFIQEFVKKIPWIHIDMEPVNWLRSETSYCSKGATGYGVELLYEFLKIIS